MKATFVFVVSLVVGGASSVAAEPLAPAPTIRALDAIARDAYALGAEASPVFRALVQALEARDVVVHVLAGRPQVFGAIGATRVVGCAGSWRYFRIELDDRRRPVERASVLAHELRHVLEIVAAAAATQDDVRRLYERIGRPVGGTRDAFETADAAATGVQVLREIRAFTSSRSARTTPSLAPD